MKRTLGRAKGRLGETIRTRYRGLLRQITEMVRNLPSDGTDKLLRWSGDRKLPSELHWLVVHLLDRWRQLAVHQRRPGVPDSTNLVGGKVRADKTQIQDYKRTEDRFRSAQLHGGGLRCPGVGEKLTLWFSTASVPLPTLLGTVPLAPCPGTMSVPRTTRLSGG